MVTVKIILKRTETTRTIYSYKTHYIPNIKDMLMLKVGEYRVVDRIFDLEDDCVYLIVEKI